MRERVEAETISIETSAVGHPLLVKVSYHPRWRAEGADGPYLVSPALMLIVPRQPTVRLVYATTWADAAGRALTLAGLGLCLVGARRRRPSALRAGPPPDPGRVRAAPSAAALGVGDPGGAARRPWRVARFAANREAPGAAMATALVRGGVAGLQRPAVRRGAPSGRREPWPWRVPAEVRAELLCLRGESLLEAGSARDAAEGLRRRSCLESPRSPYAAQALYGAVRAKERTGGASAAAGPQRRRLETEFADDALGRPAQERRTPLTGAAGVVPSAQSIPLTV